MAGAASGATPGSKTPPLDTDPGTVAVAFALRGRAGGALPELSGAVTSALRGAGGGSSRDYVAFSAEDHGADAGALSPTLRAGQHDASHPNGGAPPAVASELMVRRLMPVECERLQGLPDGWTAMRWRGREAEACPDGPRYHAIGNAMAVSVVRWIGERIEAEWRIAT